MAMPVEPVYKLDAVIVPDALDAMTSVQPPPHAELKSQ